MMKRSVYVVGLLSLFLVALGVPELFAQTSPPPPALPGMPDQAPIDGGLSILAAAGGAYAWRKLRNKRS
jgi:hypothetical protein